MHKLNVALMSLLVAALHSGDEAGNPFVMFGRLPPGWTSIRIPQMPLAAWPNPHVVSASSARSASEAARRYIRTFAGPTFFLPMGGSLATPESADESVLWGSMAARKADAHQATPHDWLWITGHTQTVVERDDIAKRMTAKPAASTVYALSGSSGILIRLLDFTNPKAELISLSGTAALVARSDHAARLAWACTLRWDADGLATGSAWTRPERESVHSATSAARINIQLEGFTTDNPNIGMLKNGIEVEQIQWFDADGATVALWWVHPNRSRALVLFDRRIHMAWFDEKPIAQLPNFPKL